MDLKTVATPDLHVRGATVLHQSPFSELEVPEELAPLLSWERDRWVKPLYLDCLHRLPKAEGQVALIHEALSACPIDRLLAQLDWRPRIVAALVIATFRLERYQEWLSRLLLRSDVCYAGSLYCLAMVRFNNANAVDTLSRYLDYYLSQPRLHFEQADAMAALQMLDAVNATNHAAPFVDRYQAYRAARGLPAEALNIVPMQQRCAHLQAIETALPGR